MLDSEERNLEAHPECTRTTDVASCDILDKEVVPLHDDCSDDKKTDGQQSIVPIVLTAIMNPQEIASSATYAWQPGDPCGVVDMWEVSNNLGPQLGDDACGLDGLEAGGSTIRLHGSSSRLTALDTSTRGYIVEPKLKKCVTATSSMMLCPKTAELTGRRPTHVRLHRVLDLYRENVLRDINPIKMKGTCECSLSAEEPVKFEWANKKDGWRQAMDKPMTGKSMTWMLRGTAKVIPWMMRARRSWRIWDPGRS
jgi:hypothetical protein